MSNPFDDNAWYQITESRVDFNSSMQLTGTDLVFTGASDKAPQFWQVFNIGSGQYVFRNQNNGLRQQLGTCYAAKELDASKTKPCMQDSDGNDFQKWTINGWGDGTYRIQNVGNGTDYNLDCHPGNPLFLSSVTAETPKQPAQHWMFSSRKAIDDGAFSTTFTSKSSSTSTRSGTRSTSTSTSGSGSDSDSTAASSSNSSGSTSQSSGLSSGARIGLGVGIGLAVLLLAVLGVVFFLKRRRRHVKQPQEIDSKPSQLPAYEAPIYDAKKQPQHEMFTPPAELPGSDAAAHGPHELYTPHKRDDGPRLGV